MLLLWYNTSHNNFYLKDVAFGTSLNLEVGYVNGFGHILVAIYVRKGLSYVSCSSVKKAYFEKEEFTYSKKNKLITHLIEFLDKKRRKF